MSIFFNCKSTHFLRKQQIEKPKIIHSLAKDEVRNAKPHLVDEPTGKEHCHEKRADGHHGDQARRGLVKPPHSNGKIVEN